MFKTNKLCFDNDKAVIKKFILDIETNLFDELSSSTTFEDVGKGRKGAIIVNIKNNLIPIIRTTTNYNNPVQNFLPIHYR